MRTKYSNLSNSELVMCHELDVPTSELVDELWQRVKAPADLTELLAVKDELAEAAEYIDKLEEALDRAKAAAREGREL